MAQYPDPAPLRFSDLWPMVCRHRTTAGVCALIAGLLVIVLPSHLSPSLYRAEATLTMGRDSRPVSFQYDPAAGLLPDQLINTQREQLASKGLLAQALAMGGLLANPAYTASSDPVALLQRRLRSSVLKNSWVIAITLDDEDPVRATAGLQSVLDAFLARQSTLARDRSGTDIAFVDSQLGEVRNKLETAQNAERQFRLQHAIASIDPDQNHITARIHTLAERQAALDDRVAGSGALFKQVQAADSIGDRQLRLSAYLRIDSISTFTVVGALQQDLFRLQGQEAELSIRYLDKHPKMLEIRSHIAAKRAQLEETIATVRAAIESDYLVLVEQRASLSRAQEELQRDLNGYRDRLLELKRLSLETQAQQKVHDELQGRLAQLKAMAGYDDRRMAVSDPPKSSPVPGGIGTVPLLMLAVLGGSAAAVAAAAVADGIDRTVRDGRQVQAATGLRTLGLVPGQDRLQPLCASGPGEPPEFAEAMRALWTAWRYVLPPGEGARVLLLVSPTAGDGRSTVAARLAAGIALAGSRVLLVEGDLRLPTLTAQLGVTAAQGLSQLLAGKPDLAPVPTAIPNLDLMPAGPVAPNPGELLNSHCLPEWIAYIRQQYDVVVIDSPGLDSCSDGLLLGEHADAIGLLVRAGATERQALATSWECLTPLHPRISGFVLVEGGATRPAGSGLRERV